MHTLISDARGHVILTLAGLLIAGLATTAHAQTPSYSVSSWDFDGASAGQSGDYTLGYRFTPTQNIAVTALGEWDSKGLPINSSEHIGIFDSGGALLFSTTFTDANATLSSNTITSGDEAGGKFRYTPITSQYTTAARTLLAGDTYTIGASVGNNSYATSANGLTSAPGITLVSGGLYNSGDTVGAATPTPPSGDGGYNMYGANFEFTTNLSGAAATPEPGTWALLSGLAVCGLKVVRRRSRKA